MGSISEYKTIAAAPPGTDLGRHYAENGLVHIAQVLGRDDIDAIRSTFMEQVESDNSLGHDDGVGKDDVLARYPRFIHPHRRPELAVGKLSRKYMMDRRIVDKVEAMVGPVNGAQSMFYFKPPGARGQSMHQDNLFLQASPETCIAVWIAIDPVSDENGGLRMVPGSHRYELQCPGEADQETSFSREAVRLPDDMVPERTAMEAGDAVFFHGSTVHGSGPNLTADRFRRSLIFHYIPQSSVQVAKFYLPLTSPTGEEILVPESAAGGICGEGWEPAGPH
jgi:phytanoyl-CoA hydroxylase